MGGEDDLDKKGGKEGYGRGKGEGEVREKGGGDDLGKRGGGAVIAHRESA